MAQVSSPVEAIALAQSFLIDSAETVPELFRKKLRELVTPGKLPGPIAIQKIAELCYAWRDKLPKEAIEVGLQNAGILVMYQQFGYQDGRGQGMVSAFNGGTDDLPKPDPEFSEETLSQPPASPVTPQPMSPPPATPVPAPAGEPPAPAPDDPKGWS